jgi:hypothetical protein
MTRLTAFWPREMRRHPDGRLIVLEVPDSERGDLAAGVTVEVTDRAGRIWVLKCLEVGERSKADVWRDRNRPSLLRWRGKLLDPTNWPNYGDSFFALFESVKRPTS